MASNASQNSLVNLAEGGVITMEWVDNYLRKKKDEENTNVNEVTS